MSEPYEFSFKGVSKKYGVTTRSLVDARIISEREADLIDNRKVKAIRLSTLTKICDTVGCSPGDFFLRSSETWQ